MFRVLHFFFFFPAGNNPPVIDEFVGEWITRLALHDIRLGGLVG